MALAAANRKEPQWIASIRFPFTVAVPIRTITEFYWAQPAATAVISVASNGHHVQGNLVFAEFAECIDGRDKNAGVTYAADAYYGNTVDRFSVSATVPSASTYISWIGTEQILSSVIDRYKRLWVRKTRM